MTLRSRLAVAVTAGALLLGVALGPVAGFAVTLPAAVATAGLAGLLVAGPAVYGLVPAVTATVSLVTLTATVLHRNAAFDVLSNVFALIELAALIWLVVLLVRHAPPRVAWAVGALATIAEVTQILRTLEPSAPTTDVLFGMAFWSLGSICAVLGGLYLRSLDARRLEAVETARRTQRLDLARDLHDFVAHDVSGIVVQAQAAQVVADRDPAAVLAALRRIEEAGLQALAAMDRTVHMLRDTEQDGAGDDRGTASRAPVQGVPDLPELVERFSASGTATARLEVDPALEDRLTREASATAYRIVVEALTNVRRHAPTARTVDVALTVEDSGVGVTVTNDAGSGPGAPVIDLDSAHRRGGLGLVGLTERVEASGGTLRAGPYGDTGWQVHAHLPLPDPGTPSAGTRPPGHEGR